MNFSRGAAGNGAWLSLAAPRHPSDGVRALGTGARLLLGGSAGMAAGRQAHRSLGWTAGPGQQDKCVRRVTPARVLLPEPGAQGRAGATGSELAVPQRLLGTERQARRADGTSVGPEGRPT